MFVVDCYGHNFSNGVLFAYHIVVDVPEAALLTLATAAVFPWGTIQVPGLTSEDAIVIECNEMYKQIR